MTCQEFERVLPELEGGRNFEADEHLRMCSRCWDLVSDLDSVAQEARLLQGTEDPSPRVWNSIEIILRQEGLIHESQLDRPARQRSSWGYRWLVPVTAVLLLMSGLALHQYRTGIAPAAPRIVASTDLPSAKPMAPMVDSAGRDEAQLLNVITARAPGLRAGYADDLQAVDAYIHDAELSARANPNDEIAQQYLTNAYEQRAMVYEIAMARTLP